MKVNIKWEIARKIPNNLWMCAVLGIVLCILTFFALTYSSLTSERQYQISDLRLKQHETHLLGEWNGNAKRYEVFIKGKKAKCYSVDSPAFDVPLGELGREYTVILFAKDANGGLSAGKRKKIYVKKVKQHIATCQEDFTGLGKKTQNMFAEASGRLTFSTSDPRIVRVSQDGTLRYIKEGRAEIVVTATETPQMKPGRKTVSVLVYPDRLKTPAMSITAKTHDDVTLEWSHVKYAKKYILEKRNPVSGEYQSIAEFPMSEQKAVVNRVQSDYVLRATATVNGEEITSNNSDNVEVKTVAEEAPTYKSSHNLKTLDMSTLSLVTKIDGDNGANVPQSMSFVNGNYVVTFVNKAGSKGVLKTYSPSGKLLGKVPISGMGHANGSTYNPNTDRIYTVKTHKHIWSPSCTSYKVGDGYAKDTFDLPKNTSGIAYDENTNKYVLSKGNELYLTDSDFKVEKFMWKSIRYNHAQDIGVYGGVVMVCTWVSGNTSYIDLYRISDGAYLGSYSVPFGEIESCFVDGGYLIILMNNAKGDGDCIVRTKEKIEIP